MKKTIYGLGVVLVLSAGHALSQGSLDDLVEACEVPPLTIASKLINSTAILVPGAPGYVVDNGNGTYTILNGALTVIDNHPGSPLCTDSRFYGERTSYWGRSGVLVGSNLIMTAPHTSNFNPQNFVVVFGLEAQHGTCSPFDWNSVPAENVYFPSSATPVANTHGGNGRYDYVVFELDRPVTGRQPIRVRRSGEPAVGDIVIAAGHPHRLPKKVDTAGIVTGFVDQYHQEWLTHPGDTTYINIHGFHGSSGSPIFNLKDQVLETVLSRGNSGWHDYNVNDNCRFAVHQDFDQSNLRSRINGDIADVANAVPRFEIAVAPQSMIVHKTNVGAALSQPTSDYTITAPGNATAYSIGSPTTTGPGGPSISSSLSPGVYSMTPNEQDTITLTASTSQVISCNIWDVEVPVQDLLTGFVTPLRHRFEIGMKEVRIVEADEEWSTRDLGFPFLKTKTFTVENLRPISTLIYVNAGEYDPGSWAVVNGGGGFNLTLAPQGMPGSVQTFTAGFNQSFGYYPPHTEWKGFVGVSINDHQCATHGYLRRNVSYTHGSEEYTEVQTVLTEVPTPPGGVIVGQSYGASLNFDLDLTQEGAHCVGDANLKIGFAEADFIATLEEAAQLTRITLIGPDATSAVLWQSNAIPSSDYIVQRQLWDPVFLGSFVRHLSLDDQSTPPLGGGSLSVFNGKAVAGQWRVELRRRRGDSQQASEIIVPGVASLELTVGPCF